MILALMPQPTFALSRAHAGRRKLALLCFTLMLVCTAPARLLAQSDLGESDRRDDDRKNADRRDDSRRDDGGEAVVSLSAATLSEILRREPGLLLEVKRLLVRQAYEQGRSARPRRVDR